nr:LOW QUALITY PROTEIN: uncharacterized protein LOC110551693 [Meriones unguiculatus]
MVGWNRDIDETGVQFVKFRAELRAGGSGANTPEPSDAPPEVASLEKDVRGTEAQLAEGPATQPRCRQNPASPSLSSAWPALPTPPGAEKLTPGARTRAHQRAAAPPTWPAPGTAPRGAPPTPPGGCPGRKDSWEDPGTQGTRPKGGLGHPPEAGRSREPPPHDGAAALTQAADLEAGGGPQRPARPALAQRLQMLLLALDQQDLLVDPAQEKSLGHRSRDLLVPEVLHVLRFEIREDLVADVVSGELSGFGGDRRRGLIRRGLLLRGAVGRAQDDGQGVRRDLQKLLHLPRHRRASHTRHRCRRRRRAPLEGGPRLGDEREVSGSCLGVGGVRVPSPPAAPRRSPAVPGRNPREGAAGRRAVAQGRDSDAKRAGPRGPSPVTCKLRATPRRCSFSSRGTLASLWHPAAPAGVETRRKGAEGAGSWPRSGEFPWLDAATGIPRRPVPEVVEVARLARQQSF